MRLAAMLASLVVLASPAAALAHHSVTAHFDRDKAVAINGRVLKVRIENPHSTFEVQVQGPSGAPVVWMVESSSRAGMQRIGLSERAVAVGDEVKITAYPARDGSRSAWLTRLETRDRVFDVGYRRAAPPTPVPAH